MTQTTPEFVMPPATPGGPKRHLVSLWLPEDLLADVRDIRAATGEDVAGVLARLSRKEVAAEAKKCRFEGA